ncbi:MAG: endonuclease III [Candidatus Aenigmarchaeota archaeon ex4484_224]|nr:MAG: endonuclease III [Candidatus Aenigmarchaeota archaeon ex4484_224]
MKFDESKLEKILEIMEKEARKRNAPVYQKEKTVDKDPFKILIFAFLSTRTKDETTIKICKKLFQKVKNLDDLIKIDLEKLEKILYEIGFYKQKARNLKELAFQIKVKYNGKIPSRLEELIKLKGIGKKVAKVILNEAFDKPYIAVDVHVHRISNRIGLIKTKSVEESDEILNKIIPKKLKKKFNKTLVAFGQTICKPIKPLCKECPLKEICPKIGV